MATFYANPYDITYAGFYFDSAEDYAKKAKAHPAEEFEIDFIDGSAAEAELAEELSLSGYPVSQGNLDVWFDQIELLSEYEMAQVAVQADRAGPADDLDDIIRDASDVDLSPGSLADLAYDYVQEGIIDIERYFDETAYGRDIRINGDHVNFLYDDKVYYEMRNDTEEAQNIQEMIDNELSKSDRQIGEEYVEMVGGAGELPRETQEMYVDYDAVARDLGVDHNEISFAGTTYVVGPS